MADSEKFSEDPFGFRCRIALSDFGFF